MKRCSLVVLSLFSVLAFVLINVNQTASANPGSILSGGNDGYWQYPPEIKASESKPRLYGYPNYLQIISNALSTDRAAKICHTFDGGKWGWIAEFRQWYDYRWHSMKEGTTIIHDTTANSYLACVNTPSNGVYALFAWYPIQEPTQPVHNTNTSVSFEGHWNSGVEIEPDMILNPYPNWLSRFSKGVRVEQNTTLCHPFSKGSDGWQGEIRQLKKGEWIKVPTEEIYIPTTEGVLHACASVTKGTYALFGYQ